MGNFTVNIGYNKFLFHKFSLIMNTNEKVEMLRTLFGIKQIHFGGPYRFKNIKNLLYEYIKPELLN